MGFAVAVDPVKQNVYVTGWSQNTGTNSYDIVTIMYDPSGVEKWVKRYRGPVDGLNRGTSLALDAEGNVYVAGWSEGTGSIDFVTLKYDLNGNEQWVARYDGPEGSNDQPAPPVGATVAPAFANYIQNNQGIIVTKEGLDPLPALGHLMARLDAMNLDNGVRNSLRAKLDVCVESLLAANAEWRQNAANTLNAFINELQGAVVKTQITEAEGSELAAIGKHIVKAILGNDTTVVYVAGQSTIACELLRRHVSQSAE